MGKSTGETAWSSKSGSASSTHSRSKSTSPPHDWDAEMFEFHRNDSTWCADNALDDIEEFKEKKGASCLCAMMQAKFLEVVDNTPRLS